jgi:hypothetical protein
LVSKTFHHFLVCIQLKKGKKSFTHQVGQGAKREHIFGLSNPTGGGVHIILFVSSLRLDLANRTVVLDAAVLPLYNALMPKIHGFLGALTQRRFCQIKVDDAEMRFWKRVLPAMVERCRTWAHRSGCEYAAKGQIPLSVEEGEKGLCSCGNGVVHEGLLEGVSGWKGIAKYVVRAAISPAFPSALVDKMFEPKDLSTKLAGLTVGDGCRVCKCSVSKTGGALLTCGRCQKARYCSRECQRMHWKTHKAECAAPDAK